MESQNVFEPNIMNCPPIFEVSCPRQFSELNATDSDDIRFCETCRKNVYYCATPEQFLESGRAGKCVAIPANAAGAIRSMWVDPRMLLLGMPSKESLQQWAANRDMLPSWLAALAKLPTDTDDHHDD